jgi:hypothetical protein
MISTAIPVGAQTLLKDYQRLRVQELAREAFNERGHRMRFRRTVQFPTAADSIAQQIADRKKVEADVERVANRRFTVRSWHNVDVKQEARFMALFNSREWAFIGASTRQRVDTTRTSDLRARMQATFGHPTRTLAELGPVSLLSRDQIIEFEYWFVLNDSIPVIVMDTNGPWDRGVVLASSIENREVLADLKAQFLGQLLDGNSRNAFADYYYNPEQDAWYVTGYDGAYFYDRRIEPPDLAKGRPDIQTFITNGDQSPN